MCEKEEWRVIRWGQDVPELIQYRDGKTQEVNHVFDLDYEGEQFEDWQERMWIECSDDCDDAGVPVRIDGTAYDFSNHPIPTRWRPAGTMPPWAERTE